MIEPRSRKDLVALDAQGQQVTYLYFWGHQPLPTGEIGRSCLSQWWPSAFTVDGATYPSSEHWMMANKARLFGDEETAAKIVTAEDPKAAKALGREVRGFNEQTWSARRFDIVVDGSIAKFSQHPRLRDYLLSTDQQVLVEASPDDRVWGIGLVAADVRARQPSTWRGLNLLGFALMEARSVLSGEPGRRDEH